MSISEFIDGVDPERRVLTVLNQTGAHPIYELLEVFFEGMSVDVTEAAADGETPTDAVILHDGDDPMAISSLEAVQNSVLMVNSDAYITGSRSIDEVATPDVITALDTVLVPGGAPDEVEDKNKFLLIQISRHIEAMAWQADGGQLHSSFQYLSRLTMEPGTEQTYRLLGNETDVDVHVYGIGDEHPPESMTVTPHTGEGAELRDSWFVIHDGAGNDAWKAALIAEAVEPGANAYRGFWTFEPDRVDRMLEYVTDAHPADG